MIPIRSAPSAKLLSQTFVKEKAKHKPWRRASHYGDMPVFASEKNKNQTQISDVQETPNFKRPFRWHANNAQIQIQLQQECACVLSLRPPNRCKSKSIARRQSVLPLPLPPNITIHHSAYFSKTAITPPSSV